MNARYTVEPLPTDQKVYLSPHERHDAERGKEARLPGGPGNTPFLPDAVVIDTQAQRPQHRAVAVARRADAERIAARLNAAEGNSFRLEGPPADAAALLVRLERRMGSMKMVGDRDDLLLDAAVFIAARARAEA